MGLLRARADVEDLHRAVGVGEHPQSLAFAEPSDEVGEETSAQVSHGVDAKHQPTGPRGSNVRNLAGPRVIEPEHALTLDRQGQ